MLLCCLHERRTENEKEKEKEGCTAAALCFALACTLRYATRPCCMHTCTLAQHGCMLQLAWVRTLVRTALRSSVASCIMRALGTMVVLHRPLSSLPPPRPSAHYLSASLRPAPPFSRTSHTRNSHSLRSLEEEEGFREAVCCCAHCSLGARPFPFPCCCFSTC